MKRRVNPVGMLVTIAVILLVGGGGWAFCLSAAIFGLFVGEIVDLLLA